MVQNKIFREKNYYEQVWIVGQLEYFIAYYPIIPNFILITSGI